MTLDTVASLETGAYEQLLRAWERKRLHHECKIA